jgi:hypothetical protein
MSQPPTAIDENQLWQTSATPLLILFSNIHAKYSNLLIYKSDLYVVQVLGENCYYRTRNNGLRYYRTPIVDFAKTTFETLALCYT